MANENKKNGNTAPVATPSQPAAEETPAAPVVKVDKAALKALFAAYDKADERVEALKAEGEKAVEIRSKACKAIHDAAGKGPFGFKGDTVKIVARGDTFFFRGKSNKDVLEID